MRTITAIGLDPHGEWVEYFEEDREELAVISGPTFREWVATHKAEHSIDERVIANAF